MLNRNTANKRLRLYNPIPLLRISQSTEKGRQRLRQSSLRVLTYARCLPNQLVRSPSVGISPFHLRTP